VNHRTLGKTGYRITEIGVGTWQLGGGWGQPFDEKQAVRTLNEAFNLGYNFVDTADCYSDQLSERAVGRVVRSRSERIYVATKIGRRLKPHVTSGYNEANIRRFVEESRQNLGMDRLDLVQLHCPTTEVFYHPEVFDLMDRLVEEKKVAFYGVSVQQVEQALKAIEYPNLATVQIVFNMFRERPKDILLPEAKKRNVGIIARVPLASGLLSGKYKADTSFPKGDYRLRHGRGEPVPYDPDGYGIRGEMFAGVDYETGLKAVDEIKEVIPEDKLGQFALRWILMHDAISVTVVGAGNEKHLRSNWDASEIPALSEAQMKKVEEVYKKYFGKTVHQIW
jgi:aryl-alcohol dehydrogenase-like predicted oxidoreductase